MRPERKALQSGYLSSGFEQSTARKLLFINPWGLSGGYSGPVMLMNRIGTALVVTYDVVVDVAHGSRTVDRRPTWCHNAFPIASAGTGRRFQLWWLLRLTFFLVRRGRNYDGVVFQGGYLFSLLAVLVLRRGQLRAVLPVVEAGDLSVPRGRVLARVQAAVLRHTLRRVDSVLCLSDGIKREAVNLGVSPQSCVHLANPAERIGSARRAAPSPLSIRLGFVGKLGPTKQPDAVIQAVRRLRDQGFNASATLVGPYASADYERYIAHLVRSLDLQGHIHLPGMVENVSRWLETSMDLFVLPSLSEGMPGALAEALAAGLPCLVSDVGAMAAVAEGSGAGRVVAPSAAAVAEAAAELAKSASAWQAHSDAALKYAQLYLSPSASARTVARTLNLTPRTK